MNFNEVKVNIHLGAHKTATTYVQKVMTESKLLLEQKGVFYLPLSEMRPNFTRLLRNPKVLVEDAQMAYKKLIGERFKTLLISEENLIGNAKEIVKGSLYQTTKRTVKRIAEIFIGANTTLFLTLRNYSTFFPSMYCEYILHNSFISFEEFCENQNLKAFNWKVLIDQIQSQMGVNMQLKVLIYEELKTNFDCFFKSFTKFGIKELSAKEDEVVRLSYKAETIEMLQNLSKKFSQQQAVNIANAMHSAMIIEGVGSKFEPFSKEIRNEFHKKYITDIADIRNINPEIVISCE